MLNTTDKPLLEETLEARTLLVSSRPITYDEYLDILDLQDDVELIDGVVQKRMAAQIDHERLLIFLLTLLNLLVEENDLGQIFGSRTPVQISMYRGRLPDLLFVRKDRALIVDTRGLREAPDLVIELVSPGDRPSDLMALEVDYRGVGVPEIVFVDQQRQRIRVLRAQSTTDDATAAYDEETLTAKDALRLVSLGSVTLPAAWLLTEPRPTVRAALMQLLPS